MTTKSPGSSRSSLATQGFTLVELLVVIGIIALLISILLPSLATARRTAQRVACAAKLQQIMIAAQMHASNHQGFYPIVGAVGDITPAGLGDSNRQHYDYIYNDLFPNLPVGLAPITTALAHEMGFKGVLEATSNTVIAKQESDSTGFMRSFWCPSQASSFEEFRTKGDLFFGVYNNAYGAGTFYSTQSQSYIYNECVLGVDDSLGRLRGKASSVRQSAKTLFAADGMPGSVIAQNSSYSQYSSGDPMYTVYNNFAGAPITLGDVNRGLQVAGKPFAGDATCFDKLRHRGKINIAFCDGHVETSDISTKDLTKVFVLAP